MLPPTPAECYEEFCRAQREDRKPNLHPYFLTVAKQEWSRRAAALRAGTAEVARLQVTYSEED